MMTCVETMPVVLAIKERETGRMRGDLRLLLYVTEGCLLVGETTNNSPIRQSKVAFERLFGKLKSSSKRKDIYGYRLGSAGLARE